MRSAWGFGVSRSGPLMGFWGVTVWSAVGVLESHGLVRSWGFGLSLSGPLMRSWGPAVSRSGPLMGFGSVTV